jgi:hypothetical protein
VEVNIEIRGPWPQCLSPSARAVLEARLRLHFARLLLVRRQAVTLDELCARREMPGTDSSGGIYPANQKTYITQAYISRQEKISALYLSLANLSRL